MTQQSKRINCVLIIAAAAAAVASCTQSIPMILEPANKLAQTQGLPKIRYVDYGARGGTVTAIMPGGEILSGRLRFVQSANIVAELSSGRLTDALGVGGHSGFVFRATGPDTILACRGLAVFEHGRGECQTSSGAKYQIRF